MDKTKHLPRQILQKVRTAALNLIPSLPVTIGYMAVATIISTVMFDLSNNVIIISIIYILAIILIARATNCYGAGILASVFSVFWMNFAFTYPHMSLNFTLPGYPLTFLGMAVISCVTSSISIMTARQNQQLQEQDRMLMKAEKETMRANLMRAVSHDLRTPLTTIIGSSSAYLEREASISPEETHDLMAGIAEDAQWLLTMVENLLSVTRMLDEKGAASVTKTDEPLEEVISAAIQRFHRRFPDILVHVAMPEAFLMVPMDATLIEQVINNLLENVCFHSQSTHPIDLIVTTREKWLCVTVKDYGNGIDPELLQGIFDGGAASARSSSDGHKGMGIGLTLCKTIITAHGGTIHAANHEQGALFTFTLPDWKEF